MRSLPEIRAGVAGEKWWKKVVSEFSATVVEADLQSEVCSWDDAPERVPKNVE
jgi:hypothetical protein